MQTLSKKPAIWPSNLDVGIQGALFLDRDGVINADYGYAHSPEDFHFMDGIFDVTHEACSHGYRIAFVTNQAGIGRGLDIEPQFQALTDSLCHRLLQERAPIERVYFCPIIQLRGRVGTSEIMFLDSRDLECSYSPEAS